MSNVAPKPRKIRRPRTPHGTVVICVGLSTANASFLRARSDHAEETVAYVLEQILNAARQADEAKRAAAAPAEEAVEL